MKKKKGNSFRKEIKKAGMYVEKTVGDIWNSVSKSFKGDYPQAKETLKKGFIDFENTVKKTFKKKKKRGILKRIGLILLNIILTIPLWFLFFSVLVAMIILGWGILFLGIATFIFMVFSLAMPYARPINSILLSVMFFGLGVFFFGNVMSSVFWRLNKFYFKITRKYLKWNRKAFVGGSK